MSYKISVIIVDNRRRIFVEEAVKSAIQQTLDRGEYEVIVVKNYDDEELDRELTKLGVTVLRSGAERGGALYSEGIEAADGEVLALLDDDDMFSHEKLRVVLDSKTKKCSGCSMSDLCEGVKNEYLDYYGDQELHAI